MTSLSCDLKASGLQCDMARSVDRSVGYDAKVTEKNKGERANRRKGAQHSCHREIRAEVRCHHTPARRAAGQRGHGKEQPPPSRLPSGG